MKSKRCPCCDEVISYEKRRNRFCNHSCAATFTNRARPRRAIVCASCGQALHRGKYCSVKCQRALVYRQYVERWLRGDETGIVSNGLLVSNHIKRWLRETRGEKCERCGWALRHTVTGKVPVQVNHKDGDALNNRPENLELLCPNCHSLTPTFGALNMGNGRAARRARA